LKRGERLSIVDAARRANVPADKIVEGSKFVPAEARARLDLIVGKYLKGSH